MTKTTFSWQEQIIQIKSEINEIEKHTHTQKQGFYRGFSEKINKISRPLIQLT